MNQDTRKRLEEAVYPDLGAMMAAYSLAAVAEARDTYRQRLDPSFPSPESLEAFEAVLSELAEKDQLDYDHEVKLWGSYLGELLRTRYAGSWEMSQYPGGVAAVPAVEVRGSRLFPLMKVYRRLTMGDGESTTAFFAMVTERLGKPARVN